MKAPPIPADELERLRSLHRLGLLDTPAEERFDRITRMARRLLGTEMALMTLVDADRVWMKSAQGSRLTQTPRAAAFCSHAILSPEPLVVPDAREDPRFAKSPLVTEAPSIRMYAGQPIHAPDGRPIGALCVADAQPRVLEAEQVQVLQSLAEAIERELEVEVLSPAERELRATLAKAEDRAAVDPVTRLWRRGPTLALLERVLAQEGARVAVAVVDVDHLAAIHARGGRPAGDEVLRAVAERVRQQIRSVDAVGRWGEGELLLVFEGCTETEARRIADRVRVAISDAPIPLPHGEEIGVTASFGVWCGRAGRDVAADLVIEGAQQALGRAHGAGHDRVQLSRSRVKGRRSA